MKRNLKFLIIGLLIVSISFVATPVYVVGQTRPNIKIGALGPLAIPVGVDMKNAAELAVAEINAGSGVDVGGTAHNFELTSETTSGTDGLPDPTTAATNLQKLVLTDGVVAVLGGFRTEVVLGAIEPTINSTQTPFLGVGSTAPIITEYYYRVGPPNGTTLARNLISVYGTHLLPNNGVQNVTIVREDAAWTEAIGASVKGALIAYFEMTVDDTTVAAIPEGASSSDVATALNPLVTDDDTDALITLFSAPVGKAVTEQWAALGLNSKMMLAGINVAAQDSEYFVNTGGAAAGEIMTLNAPPGENPTEYSQAFRDAYIAEFDEEPTYTAFAAYDAVFILKEAIERADAFTSAAIQAELPNTDYTGAATRYKFTSESSAGQVASSSVPADFKKYNNTVAHDLYTPSTIGVSGFPYSQLYYGQWLENGSLGAIWAGSSTGFPDTIDPPYVAETTTSSATSAATSTTVGTSASPATSDSGLFPGFELYVVMFSMATIVITRIRRRKD